MTDDIGGMSLDAEFIPLDGGTMTLEQRWFGLNPALLVEPEEDETTGDVTLKLKVWGMDDPEAVAAILEMIVEGLRRGEVTVEE